MGYEEAAGQIATTAMPATPRQITPGAYNPAVFKAKADKDAYAAAVARSLGGAGGPGALQDALVKDPVYQKLSQAHADAQQAHVLGVATPEYGRMQAATNYLANAAGAVSTDAGSRQTQAAGQRIADEGLGAERRGAAEQSLANADQTRQMTPVQVAAGYLANNHNQAMSPALVDQTKAGTAKTTAEAGKINTESQYYPQIEMGKVAMGQQDRSQQQTRQGLQNQLTQAQIDAEKGLAQQRGSEAAAVGSLLGNRPAPAAAGAAPTPQPAAVPQSAPATRPGAAAAQFLQAGGYGAGTTGASTPSPYAGAANYIAGGGAGSAPTPAGAVPRPQGGAAGAGGPSSIAAQASRPAGSGGGGPTVKAADGIHTFDGTKKAAVIQGRAYWLQPDGQPGMELTHDELIRYFPG